MGALNFSGFGLGKGGGESGRIHDGGQRRGEDHAGGHGWILHGVKAGGGRRHDRKCLHQGAPEAALAGGHGFPTGGIFEEFIAFRGVHAGEFLEGLNADFALGLGQGGKPLEGRFHGPALGLGEGGEGFLLLSLVQSEELAELGAALLALGFGDGLPLGEGPVRSRWRSGESFSTSSFFPAGERACQRLKSSSRRRSSGAASLMKAGRSAGGRFVRVVSSQRNWVWRKRASRMPSGRARYSSTLARRDFL